MEQVLLAVFSTDPGGCQQNFADVTPLLGTAGQKKIGILYLEQE